MSQNPFLTISAIAILKSKSGQSLDNGDVAITVENVEEFKPMPETSTKAIQHLQKLGFDVQPSEITLTLTGVQTLFEEIFKVKLIIKKDSVTGNIVVFPNHELIIPDFLTDTIEKIVFPEPPEFFS